MFRRNCGLSVILISSLVVRSDDIHPVSMDASDDVSGDDEHNDLTIHNNPKHIIGKVQWDSGWLFGYWVFGAGRNPTDTQIQWIKKPNRSHLLKVNSLSGQLEYWMG